MKMKKDLNYFLNLSYPIEIIKVHDEEGCSYSACIPQLGKYTYVAHGDTIQEAESNLNDLKEYFFERDFNDGIEIPEPRNEDLNDCSGKFVVRVSKSLHGKLKHQADENEVSMNQWIVELLAKNTIESDFCSVQNTFMENIKQMMSSNKFKLDEEKFDNVYILKDVAS